MNRKHLPSKKHLSLLIALAIACSLAACGPKPLRVSDRPAGAPRPFIMPQGVEEDLSSAAKEKCKQCVLDRLREAYTALDVTLHPGNRFAFDKGQLETTGKPNELAFVSGPPDEEKSESALIRETRVIFRFHTPDEHWVGIQPEDFSEEKWGEMVSNAPEDAEFSGLLQTAAYPYGEGLTFNHMQSEPALVVHCQVLELEPN